MLSAVGLCLLSVAGLAAAQAPAKPLVKGSDPVAKVNGRVFTQEELVEFVEALPERFQAFYKTNPREFMTMLGFIDALAKQSEARKIPELAPYKQKLEFNRMFALHEYLQEHQQNSYRVTPAEVKKAYEKSLDKYTTSKVRLIYVSFVTPPATGMSEPDAKQKIEKLHARLVAGEDFAKLAREHSEAFKERDGELGSVTKADALPEAVKAAIFALEKGQMSKPVRHDNGFYVFRCDDREVKAFDTVQEEISVELRSQMFREWLELQKKNVKVEILREEAFQTSIPSPGTAAPPPTKPPQE